MEFKVRTRKLKGSANQISGSTKRVKHAKNTVDRVAKQLDLGGSTDKIRLTLLNASSKLGFLEAATTTARRNLEMIATKYDLTETAIKNKAAKTCDPDAVRRSRDAHNKNNRTPGNSTRKGNDHANAMGGDPVNLDTGNYIYEKTDLIIGGNDEFSFSRFYNSMGANNGSLGRGWIHNYDISLHMGVDSIIVVLADGREEFFGRGMNGLVSLSGSTAILSKTEDGYKYETVEGDNYLFDDAGKFTRKEDVNGNGFSLEYSDDRLIKVTRDGGEFFSFIYYDTDTKLIAEVSDHTGRRTSFSYEGNLLVGTNTEGRICRYEYDTYGNLASIINARGIRIIHNEFDESGRTVRQSFPDDSVIAFRYDEESEATIMTERNGSESYHFHDELYRNTENIYVNGSESKRFDENNLLTYHKDRNGNETRYTYDNRGNVSKVLMANGTAVNFTYEKHNKPVTVTVNGVRKQKNVYDDKGNLLESIDGLGRTTQYKYNDRGFVTLVRRPDGHTVEVEYDDRNNVVAITEENGAKTTYEYDDLNRVLRTADGNGNTTEFEYDVHDNIIRVTNAEGAACSYTYNEIGMVTGFSDYEGAVTSLTYNALGKTDAITDPLGRVTKIGYGPMWNESSYIYPNGGSRCMEYDENNHLARVIDANGGITDYEYDGNGNIILVTDQDGAVTEFAYDVLNNLTKVTDPEGNITSYEYEDRKLTGVCRANGARTEMEYDAADQLVRETNALGESREYRYTANGDIEAIIDEAGCVTSYEYAYRNHPSRICYPDGKEDIFTYDANGNILTRSNKQGYTEEYVYDVLGRIREIRDSEGAVYSYTYDHASRITAMTDPAGNTAHYEYTLTGKLCSVTDPLGNRTEYTYDEMDRLIGIDQHGDGETHVTRYERDLEGNVVRTIDPLGLSETFRYNGRGDLIEKIDKDGYLTKYGFNGNGDLESIVYADGREVMLSYDSLRKLSKITDWTGRTSIESDILGRAIKVTYPDERFAAYTYGRAGERTSVTYPDGRVVKYAYDEGLRLSSLIEGDTEIRYSFNDAGLLAGKMFANGLAAEYAYNAKGFITGLKNSVKGETVDEFMFDYDLSGNKTLTEKSRRDLPQESGRFEYGYDALGRIETVSRDGVMVRHYSYDAFGNRTALVENGNSTEYRYNAINQLVSSRTSSGLNESFRYDKRGNLIERLIENDVAYSYAYGAINRLEKAESRSGRRIYEYNGLGHRIFEITTTAAATEKTIRYTNDCTRQYHNLLERETNGEASAFLWDGNAVAVKGISSSVLYYAKDELGSPIRLVDETGSSVAAAGYDEFGMISCEFGDMFNVQPFTYTGYRTDDIADTFFAQAREYLPQQGRFAAQDRIKGNINYSETLNNYTYCWNNPQILVDNDGQFPTSAEIEQALNRERHFERNKIQEDYINNYDGGVEKLMEDAKNGRNGWEEMSTGKPLSLTDLLNGDIIDRGVSRYKGMLHRKENSSQGRDAKYNAKYVKVNPDGTSYEVIICELPDGTSYIVTDPENMGTYNYNNATSFDEYDDHILNDMIPYFLWGNVPGTGFLDKTELDEMLNDLRENRTICLVA